VDAEECERIHLEQIYRVTLRPADGQEVQKVFDITMNATNVFTYEAYGRTLYQDSEIECEGVDWFSEAKGKTVESMQEWRSDQI
jgi:hypothetical protein